jgi:hypothetical protein
MTYSILRVTRHPRDPPDGPHGPVARGGVQGAAAASLPLLDSAFAGMTKGRAYLLKTPDSF